MNQLTVPKMGSQTRRKFSQAVILFLLILLSVIQFFPLVWLVDFSFAKTSDLFGPNFLIWPDPPQYQNYVTAWVDGHIFPYFINSFVVNVVTIVLTIVIVLAMSYAFVRMEWKLRSLAYGLVVVGMMIPIHVTLLPNFFSFNALKINDSFFGLIIPYVAFSIPLGVFLLASYMENNPKTVEEAAVIDGCNIWQVIFQIVFPLNKPAIITIAVTTFLSSWNEFIMAATYLTSDTYRTLPFAVYNFSGQYASNYAVQFAVMTLTSIPALIVYIIFNEQMTRGIMLGAVKA